MSGYQLDVVQQIRKEISFQITNNSSVPNEPSVRVGTKLGENFVDSHQVLIESIAACDADIE